MDRLIYTGVPFYGWLSSLDSIKDIVSILFVILSGLFNIGYYTWFGLTAFSFFQSQMEKLFEQDETGIAQN